LFPVCSGSSCQIHIVYNQQMPLCTKPDNSHQNATTCRNARNLCVADPNFKFDFDNSNTQVTNQSTTSDMFYHHYVAYALSAVLFCVWCCKCSVEWRVYSYGWHRL
jgi:hypothetical protein